jgi:hypothetical protein
MRQLKRTLSPQVLGKSLRATGSSERMIVLMSRDLHPGPSVEVPASAARTAQRSATPRRVADTDVERAASRRS